MGCMIATNESSIRTVKQQEAEIRGSVHADPSLAKRAAVVRNKVLVKAEKTLNVWIEEMSRKHVPVDGKVIREKALS